MDALVLGGSMFVGKRLVAHLAAEGHAVTVLNRGLTATELPVGVGRLVADRTDVDQMRAALAGHRWDAVFDVSGFVMASGGSDIGQLLDLLDGQVGHYVYVSSIMAYDQTALGVFPWTEDMAASPDGPSSYGGFKAMAERTMLERHRSTGFPVSVVRPAAIYGPDNNIFDMETAMFIRLLQGRPILVPHGGLVVGSYGHVDDLCAAMAGLVGNELAVGEIINVSTDAVTVNRYIATVAAVVDRQPVVVDVPDDALASIGATVFGHLFGRRHHAMLSSAKAERLIVAPPRYDLRAGHEHTFEWFERQGWAERTEPLSDPVWKATFDLDAELEFAARLGWVRPR